MSRSVSVPRRAVHTHFAHVEVDESWEWDGLISNLREALSGAFPSVRSVDRWFGREDHVIAANRFGAFGISEYCGLVSVWVVPAGDESGLQDRWLEQIEGKFAELVSEQFGTVLRHIDTFSNGEAVFERA